MLQNAEVGVSAGILNAHTRGKLRADSIPERLRSDGAAALTEIYRRKGTRKQRAYIALDWENIFLSCGEQCGQPFGKEELRLLTNWLSGKLDIVDSVAYVDSGTSASSKNFLDTLGYKVVNVLSRRALNDNTNECLVKNAVDVEMALGIFEATIEVKDLDAIVLLTGDGDFVPLVKRVKKRGLDVIVVGSREHTNRSLANLANEVIYIEEIIASEAPNNIQKCKYDCTNLDPSNSQTTCLTPVLQEQIKAAITEMVYSAAAGRVPLAKALAILWEYSGLKRLSDIGVKKAKELETKYPLMLKGLCIQGDQLCSQMGTFIAPPVSRGEVA